MDSIIFIADNIARQFSVCKLVQLHREARSRRERFEERQRRLLRLPTRESRLREQVSEAALSLPIKIHLTP